MNLKRGKRLDAEHMKLMKRVSKIYNDPDFINYRLTEMNKFIEMVNKKFGRDLKKLKIKE